jgi:nicotinamidase-related amidase
MTDLRFPIENSAIVVVDPYNDFMSWRGKLWPLLRNVSKQVNAIDNLQRVVETGRAKGIPIVYAPHRRYKKGQFADRKYLHPSHVGIKAFRVFEDGKYGGRYYTPIAPQAGDLISSPHSCSSGFAGTDLDAQLASRGITHITIVGYTSNTCVEATARSAVDMDYHVTLVNDAVASWTREDHHAAAGVNYKSLAQNVTSTTELVQVLDALGESNV